MVMLGAPIRRGRPKAKMPIGAKVDRTTWLKFRRWAARQSGRKSLGERLTEVINDFLEREKAKRNFHPYAPRRGRPTKEMREAMKEVASAGR